MSCHLESATDQESLAALEMTNSRGALWKAYTVQA
jgi:hypothetical protein